MATQTDEVQSIFNVVGSSSKLEKSDAVSISPRRCSRPARTLKFYVGNSRSKCTKERGRLLNLEKKSVAHEKETTGPDGKADIFPGDQQKGTDVQADGNIVRKVEAFIVEEDEETKLALTADRSLVRHPLRKQSPPAVDDQLEVEQHSTYQNANHVEQDQNISTIDTKAGISKQMKQEPEKMLDDNESLPSKRKLKFAKFTPTKNSKISEVQPRQTKQQSGLNSSHAMRVENLMEDSKNIMDVKEIMKDMSKLLPHIVLQRVSFPGIAAPSKLQPAERRESFANHPKEELNGAEAASSLKECGTATSAKLGSVYPIEENCVILDVFLSAEKEEKDTKSKSTVLVHSQTEPAVVHDDAIFKEKSCISEINEDCVATDGPAVILDVNLDICVEGGGHVELHDVKITGRKRDLSSQEEKISPEVKPLRGRRGRSPKAMAVEPVRIQRRIANSRKKLAEPSLHSLHSSYGTDVTKKREATQGLVVTAKENVVHEKVKAISVGKGSHDDEEILNEPVAGLPDNIGVAKENDVDAVSSIANQEENKPVGLEEAASNEGVYLLTGVKPPKIRRGRGGRVKIAGRERTTGKIKNGSGQSSDAETSISSEVAQQTTKEKSPALTVTTSLCIEKPTSSSEIQLNLNLFVQMTRVPEVEALAAAMKLEGSNSGAKRPRCDVPSTSPETELSAESSSAAIGLKRVRKKKKFF